MKIAVVGTGYVGLVVGACLADHGNEVICVDNDAGKIRALRRGRIPIYEPGLAEIVSRNRQNKRLAFSTSLARSVRAAEIVFIAVGTPPDEDGTADLRHVLDVATGIGRALNGYKAIVTKSTVPAGTAALVRAAVAAETDHPFAVVSNPEFLKEGAAVADFMRPDRVVIGTEDKRAVALMRTLYAPFTRSGAPIMVMDCVSAELSKYAANAMLATRISFMNEIARVCEQFSANVDDVRRAIAADDRIGPAFLFPGIGYGGSCFPKDVQALVTFSRDRGYRFRILEAVEAVNREQKSRLLEKMRAHFTSLQGKTFALWGLSFKPGTDDTRESPALTLAQGIVADGGRVVAFDPQAQQSAKAALDGQIDYAPHAYAALRRADALVIATEWNEFREPDFARMRALMRAPVIFDGRNLFTNAQMQTEGFTYYSIGR